MESIIIQKIEVTAKCDSNSSDGIKECIQLSFEKDCVVKYYHNNSKFVINSKQIIKSIFKSELDSGLME